MKTFRAYGAALAKTHHRLVRFSFFLGVFVFICGALLGWVALPHLIQHSIKLEAQLVNGSEALKTWERVPYTINVKFYIFNITNPDAIFKGEKIRLTEHGPYAYREHKRRVEVQTDGDGKHLSYKQRIRYEFDPEASNGTENDLFNIPNVPLISVAHVGRVTKQGFNLTLAHTFVRILTSSLAKESVVRQGTTAREALFGGWKLNDFYAGIPKEEMPKAFKGLRFGIFRHKNMSDDGPYVIDTGREDPAKFGQIVSWNGMKELSWWPSRGQDGDHQQSTCNRINGSDGSLFPPFITKDSVLRVFSSDTCRSVHFTFDSETTVKDIPAYRFTLHREIFASPACNKNNKCFCQKQSPKVAHHCMQGMTRLFVCRDGAPIVTSRPHFLDGGEDLFQPLVMDPPDRDIHETFIDIEPDSGVVLRARKRIQINIELQKLPGFAVFKDLNFDNATDYPSVILPMVWADERVEIDEDFEEELYHVLVRTKSTIGVAKWIVVAVGFTLCVFGGLLLNLTRVNKPGV